MTQVMLYEKTPPSPVSRAGKIEIHLPGLDGMRAISITLVLLAHGFGNWGYTNNYTIYFGHLGVSIFFVISGLLITWLMIKERERTRAFSLKNFYIRRALRILPVYWAMIVCVALLAFFHVISVSWINILHALTFTHNYPFHDPGTTTYVWWLQHTWSLSLEEQFYLIWPFVFAFLPRKYLPKTALILAFSGPLLRLANYYFLPSWRGVEDSAFHTRIDVLMMGCCIAFLLNSPLWREKIRWIPVWPTILLSAIFLLGIFPNGKDFFPSHTLYGRLFAPLDATIEQFIIAFLLVTMVAGKPTSASAFLNHPWVMHLGRLSYSLYIWQQLFLSPHRQSPLWLLAFNLVCAYWVAVCSFRLLETPFLKLRQRFRSGISV
jgi:peptidoglycan/LPS O-acetylase OafA/YrhL